jgi:hypothetical protein
MLVVVAVMRAVVITFPRFGDDARGCEGHEAGEKTALDEDSYIFHVISSVLTAGRLTHFGIWPTVRQWHHLPSAVRNPSCQ